MQPRSTLTKRKETLVLRIEYYKLLIETYNNELDDIKQRIKEIDENGLCKL